MRPKSKTPSTQLAKSAATALCTKAKPLTQLAVALCLLASKWPAPAGAMPTPRKPNFLALLKLPLCASAHSPQKSQLMLAFFISRAQRKLRLKLGNRQNAGL
jgi:hypothetical protein